MTGAGWERRGRWRSGYGLAELLAMYEIVGRERETAYHGRERSDLHVVEIVEACPCLLLLAVGRIPFSTSFLSKVSLEAFSSTVHYAIEIHCRSVSLAEANMNPLKSETKGSRNATDFRS